MNDITKLFNSPYSMDKTSEILPGKDHLCRNVNQK